MPQRVIYQIRLGFYEQEADRTETLSLIENGQPIEETSVVLGPIKVGGPPPTVTANIPSLEYQLKAVLGDIIALQAYELSREDANLRLQLIWNSLGQPAADYTIFLHLRDQTGQTVAQIDRPPASGPIPYLIVGLR